MDISGVGAIAAGAAALYLFAYGRKKNRTPETTQEMIRYKEISPGGIVELDDHRYRLVIEVEPVNMVLKSSGEQEMLWVGFRDLANSLTMPATILVQTRHLDLKDYIKEFENAAKKVQTPGLAAYGAEIAVYLNGLTEKNVRDRRHYIILKIDARSLSGIDGGVKIENEAINTLLSDIVSMRKGSGMSGGELKLLACQELENMAEVVQGQLNQMEIPNIRLNREGVLDLIYSMLLRDLAPHCRLSEASTQQIFSLVTNSITFDGKSREGRFFADVFKERTESEENTV